MKCFSYVEIANMATMWSFEIHVKN